jgi:hypothetical protein
MGFFGRLSNAGKLILVLATLVGVPIILTSLVLLSPVLVPMMIISFFVCIGMLVVQWHRRRPLGRWGVAIGASFVLFLTFSFISSAVYHSSEKATVSKGTGEKLERTSTETIKAESDNSSAAKEIVKSEAENEETEPDGPLAPDAAEYPTPSKEPIEVVLRIAGSEGGAYNIWKLTEGNASLTETLEDLFTAGEPNHKGILKSEPIEYKFNLGDGVYKDTNGAMTWDEIEISIDKAEGAMAGQWEGTMYAKLFVDGEVVDCGNTDDGFAIRLRWTPPDGAKGLAGRAICGTYPGF